MKTMRDHPPGARSEQVGDKFRELNLPTKFITSVTLSDAVKNLDPEKLEWERDRTMPCSVQTPTV